MPQPAQEPFRAWTTSARCAPIASQHKAIPTRTDQIAGLFAVRHRVRRRTPVSQLMVRAVTRRSLAAHATGWVVGGPSNGPSSTTTVARTRGSVIVTGTPCSEQVRCTHRSTSDGSSASAERIRRAARAAAMVQSFPTPGRSASQDTVLLLKAFSSPANRHSHNLRVPGP